jgi:hypothetical protein
MTDKPGEVDANLLDLLAHAVKEIRRLSHL